MSVSAVSSSPMTASSDILIEFHGWLAIALRDGARTRGLRRGPADRTRQSHVVGVLGLALQVTAAMGETVAPDGLGGHASRLVDCLGLDD